MASTPGPEHAQDTARRSPRWWRRVQVASRRANLYRWLEVAAAVAFVIMLGSAYLALAGARDPGELVPSGQAALLLIGTLIPAMGLLVLTGRRLAIRRAVLGADFVDNAIKTADDFSRPLQELVTEYCWGEVWGRPGLDRKTRSMLNLAMLAALNRPHEIKLHVRGALTNGVTKDEIKEIFLQVGIYCGVPAAVDSFRIAREVFKEMGV